MTKQVIICVDDEVTVLSSLKAELKQAIGNDYLIEITEGAEDALDLIEELLDELIAALSSIQHQLYVDLHRRTEVLTLMKQNGRCLTLSQWFAEKMEH
jgi:hypothetical protein